MDRDHAEAPTFWVEELARSDEELARGERMPSSVVHDDMSRAIAEIEAELVEEAETPVGRPRGH